MTRILAILTTTCLTLAACAGDGDTTSAATPTSTAVPPTTSVPSATTTSGSNDEPTALGASPARCTSPEGYSISHPSQWWANDGSVADACGPFGPDQIDLEPATDVTAPINVLVDPVSFISYLPTPITGADARGWAMPIDGETRVVAVDRSGEQLASSMVGS